MSATDKMRAALKAAHPKGLNIDQLHDAVGGKFTYSSVSEIARQRAKAGEFVRSGTRREAIYTLNPGWAPPRAAGRAKPTTREKPMPRKSQRRKAVNGYGRIAAKLKRARQRPALADLALDNLRAAGENLATAVREHVVDYDENPVLAQAVANHDRAIKLHDATRPA